MDIKLRKGNLPTGLLPSYFTLVRRKVMSYKLIFGNASLG